MIVVNDLKLRQTIDNHKLNTLNHRLMKYDLSEIQEVIKNRRTIYPEQFSDRKVHKEIIEDLLNAAKWAPTHGMVQPWRFKVFMEDGLKKLGEFQSNLYKQQCPPEKFKETSHNKMISRAEKSSAVIAICMKRDEKKRFPVIEEHASVACAVQNMLLIGTAYGIGCYWGTGGVTYYPEMKNYLGLEEDDDIMGFMYIGYPEIEWPKGQRRPLEYYTEWISQ